MVKSRTADKGPLNKDQGWGLGGRIECRRWRVGRVGENNGGKWGQL